ncbi:MAG: protein kinase [bacterium]|nr:protein kinase [bacterium]
MNSEDQHSSDDIRAESTATPARSTNYFAQATRDLGVSRKATFDHELPASLLSVLHDFTIEESLGRGGVGTVYAAFQVSMQRRVAIKVLHHNSLSHHSLPARFTREAWIGGRLHHPSIVKVFSQEDCGEFQCIVMEMIDGGNLAQCVATARNRFAPDDLPPATEYRDYLQEILVYFIQIADALDHIHRRGIVHRDIKPHNILVDRAARQAYLTDFGIAIEYGSDQLTRTGDFLGTVQYMSPEHLDSGGRALDHRADIWSFGVTLYEAATFTTPFAGGATSTMRSILADRSLPSARARQRHVPRDLETILTRCLQPEPGRRYATAADVRDDLQRLVDGQPICARRPSRLERVGRYLARNRRRFMMGGAAFLIATAVVVSAIDAVGVRIRDHKTNRILQQVITRNLPARALSTNWDHLEEHLMERVRARPRDPLSILARRAANGVAVRVAEFGPVHHANAVISGQARLNPGIQFDNIIDLEASWDRGPWDPVAVLYTNMWESTRLNLPLASWVDPSRIKEGPHIMRFRAHVRYLDVAGIATAARERRDYRSFDPEHPATAWPVGDSFDEWLAAARETPCLFEEDTDLGEFPIVLLGSIPDSIPSPLEITETDEARATWFAIDELVVTGVAVPAGPPAMSIDYVSGNGIPRTAACPPDIDAEPGGESQVLICTIELNGRFEIRSDRALAFEDILLRSRDGDLRVGVGSERFAVGCVVEGELAGAQHENAGGFRYLDSIGDGIQSGLPDQSTREATLGDVYTRLVLRGRTAVSAAAWDRARNGAKPTFAVLPSRAVASHHVDGVYGPAGAMMSYVADQIECVPRKQRFELLRGKWNDDIVALTGEAKWSPAASSAAESLTVRYRILDADWDRADERLELHWAVDNWRRPQIELGHGWRWSPPDSVAVISPMTKAERGWWQVTVPRPLDATELDFVVRLFDRRRNRVVQWDNNNGKDWRVDLD